MAILDFVTIGWILIGVLIGILFGATPGLTATTAVALFTPVTYYMPINTSFALLLGIYCGGFYAGSIPSILLKTPGTPGNAATALDGYPMAFKGKAGEALMHSVFSSYIGGTFSALCLLIFAPLIGAMALKFGAPEYFAVGLLGLSCVAGVSGDDLLKGVIAGLFGLMLAIIGIDPLTGLPRFTFGNSNFMGGITLVPALVGLFAISEVLSKINNLHKDEGKVVENIKMVWPDLKLYWKHKALVLKSSIIGTIIGAIPGTGPSISSWLSLNDAKRSSKHPEKFGTGIPEGIIACEASNNAVTGGALIPLLTLGVPGDTVTAVLLGALMIQGLTPGPALVVERYDLVASILWILLIGNAFMLALGLLGNRIFPYILKVRWQIVLPLIVVLCLTGGYGTNNSFFDVRMMMVLGIIGYFMQTLGFPIPPTVLGLVLGTIIEPNFRRALISSPPTVFFTRPVSLGILILTFLLLYLMHKKLKQS